jgi:tubulin polyglutamylase TTLL6/13
VRENGWRVDETAEDDEACNREWNLLWTDMAVNNERLQRMQRFQKVNHFPYMHTLARKAHLGRTLNRMLVAFAKEYKFFPKTWSLPSQWSDFVAQFADGKTNRTYIIKPDAVCVCCRVCGCHVNWGVDPGSSVACVSCACVSCVSVV